MPSVLWISEPVPSDCDLMLKLLPPMIVKSPFTVSAPLYAISIVVFSLKSISLQAASAPTTGWLGPKLMVMFPVASGIP